MRKLISFLGYSQNSSYRETTYCFDNQCCTAAFATLAMTTFFNPDEVLVLVTSEAKAQNFDDLAKQMQDQDLIAPRACDIPSGKNELEIWEILNVIADQLHDDDTIIVDVTNGYRSLPILSFIAVSYMRVARKLTIERLVYGAFEAKSNETNQTPVFDLTPFLQLLDWTTATSTFLQTGRAEGLADLAQQLGGTSVTDFATQLQVLSQELLTTRPVGVIQSISTLPDLLERVKDDQRPEIKPLGLLLDKIEQEYSQFALLPGDEIKDLSAAYDQARKEHHTFLKVQLDMINWYIGKGLPIQALSLAREWLVSLGVYYQQGIDLFNYKERGIVERILNNKPRKGDPKISDAMEQHLDEIRKLWPAIEDKNESVQDDESMSADQAQENIREVRNDIAHCGMDQGNARSATTIQEKTKEIIQKLRALLPDQESVS